MREADERFFTNDSQLGDLGQCTEIREAKVRAKNTGESAARCNAAVFWVCGRCVYSDLC